MKRKRTNNQQIISKIFKPVSKTSKNDSNELNEHLLGSISKDFQSEFEKETKRSEVEQKLNLEHFKEMKTNS